MAARTASQTKDRPAAKPRYRPESGPVWLSAGYRPFFLLAGLWSLLVLPLSLGAIFGALSLPISIDPMRWHFHELMYGYIAAALAGFLLTAVPNWTGRLPVQGRPLLGLVGLWVVGRLAMIAAAPIGTAAAAALDLLFLAGMLTFVAREIVVGRNWRNLPMVAILTAFLATNALFHAVSADLLPANGLDQRAAVACIILLLSLIGGRITPSFTRNWLAKRGSAALPAAFGALDRLALLAILIALLVWTFVPDGPLPATVAALAAALTVTRVARWQGHRVLGEPLLWVLHLGYLWIAVGLALVAASAIGWDGWDVPGVAALHAFAAGAMATMTLGVMSRAILGHGGHELRAGPGLTAAFALATLAAAARVTAALWAAAYQPLIAVAAVAWVAAFALFLLACAPKLLTARTGARGGPHADR